MGLTMLDSVSLVMIHWCQLHAFPYLSALLVNFAGISTTNA